MKRRFWLIGVLTSVLGGCWSLSAGQATKARHWAVDRPVAAAAAEAGGTIDLTRGRPLSPGYGRLVVKLRYQGAPDRRIQSGPQNAVLIVTKPGGGEVRDENGDPAVYSVSVAGTTATLILPGLPPTTPLLPGQVTGPTADAYVLNVLVGEWTGFTAPTSYADLSSGQLAYGAEPVPGSTFRLDPLTLGKDLVATNLVPPADYLVATGWTRSDVTAGVSPAMAVVSGYTHLRYHFQNSAAYLAPDVPPGSPQYAGLVSIGVRNTTVLRGLTSDSTGVFRLRHPALDPNEVDLVTDSSTTLDGGNGSNKRIMRVVVQLEGSATFASPPGLSAWTYDAANGSTASLSPPLAGRALSAFTPSGSNAAYNLAGQLAYGDLDLTGPIDTQTNVEVQDLQASTGNCLDLVLTGLPPGASFRLWAVPLGTYLSMSGAYTPNSLE